jgi:VWFA-related protein
MKESLMKSLVTALLLLAVASAQQQAPAPAPTAAPVTFKTETRLVPVDVVVQDKKGNYVRDLEQKDFKVMEDGKEQAIRNFSFEANPNSPVATQKKYLVLFFDYSSMNTGDQMQARQTAAKFIDANAGPNRLMAIANYGGSLSIAQNFTDDIERLKAVVTGVKTPTVVSNTGSSGPGGGVTLRGMGGYGQRTMLLGLASLARSLADIPGRKTLVLFSAGFPLNSEIISEVTATTDACNRANVAIYPVDVRGLTTNTMPFGPRGAVTFPGAPQNSGLALAAFPVLRIAAFFQRGGTGGGGTSGGGTSGGGTSSGGGASGGGGGARPGGGIGGGTSNPGGGGVSRGSGSSPGSGTGSTGRGSGVSNPGNSGGVNGGRGGGGGGVNPNGTQMNRTRDPYNTRGIMGRFPESATTNQQLLYMLADGTGGFVIANTNDLLGGLQKINREQNEYYLIGYNPPDSKEGSCHTIAVKVKGSYNVRARTGYCNVKSADLLAGTPTEKQLETVAQGTQAPTIQAPPMQVPFFYTSTNTAQVHVSMDIPTDKLKFEKVKGKEHAEISVMGIAYRPDGNVAAKFSDSVKLDLDDKKAVEKFASTPMHYQNQFDIASGEYNLKVVFSSGGAGFGKLETPLSVEPFDPQQFSMSALALGTDIRPAGGDSDINTDIVEGKTPLITGGSPQYIVVPAGTNRYKATDTVGLYFEIYESALEQANVAKPVQVFAQVRVLERATGAEKAKFGANVGNFVKTGQPLVPVGFQVPVKDLKPGAYRLEVKSYDDFGRNWTRTADFDIQ